MLLRDNGSVNACTVVGWNDVYWWCANLWMSFAVFYQLHKMLSAAKVMKRHKPPPLKRITIDCTMIHVFSMIMACLPLIPADWIPKATGDSGCEAYPLADNLGQTIFYWAFFMPVTALIPVSITTFLCFNIWWKKLLPPNGKSRDLLVYFARLLFLVYTVIIVVVVAFFFDQWVQAIAFMIFNLTGFVQVCLALMKKDVRNAWIQMWTCQKPPDASLTTSTNASYSEEADVRPSSTLFSRGLQFTSAVRSSLGSRKSARNLDNKNSAQKKTNDGEVVGGSDEPSPAAERVDRPPSSRSVHFEEDKVDSEEDKMDTVSEKDDFVENQETATPKEAHLDVEKGEEASATPIVQVD